MSVLKALKALLRPSDSAPAPDPREVAAKEREMTVLAIQKDLKHMAKLTQNLRNSVLQNANRFLFYANTLLSSEPDNSDLRYLAQYVPHVKKLMEGHVKWHLEQVNDLNMLLSLTVSKSLIERFANALQDKCAKIEKIKNINTNAEMKALDSILKMNGY